jgi:DNA-binding MarR family transcriptional regulator
VRVISNLSFSIAALSQMEPAWQVSLARAFAITPAGMSTLAIRLIQAGFISRAPHPDEMRSNVLHLTPRRRGLLSELHATWWDIDALIGATETKALARMTCDLNRHHNECG